MIGRPFDLDPARHDRVAHRLDRRAHIVRAVAGNVDHPSPALVAVAVEEPCDTPALSMAAGRTESTGRVRVRARPALPTRETAGLRRRRFGGQEVLLLQFLPERGWDRLSHQAGVLAHLLGALGTRD